MSSKNNNPKTNNNDETKIKKFSFFSEFSILIILCVYVLFFCVIIELIYEIKKQLNNLEFYNKYIKENLVKINFDIKENAKIITFLNEENKLIKLNLNKLIRDFEGKTQYINSKIQIGESVTKKQENFELAFDSRKKLSIKNKFLSQFNLAKHKLIVDCYKKCIRRGRNLKNPKTLADKASWVMVFDNIILKSIVADKLRVCEYAKKILGKDICIPKYSVWDNADNIDFKNLPNQFVLKTNHGSGEKFFEFIYDKHKLSEKRKKKIIMKFKKALAIDYASVGKESHYHDIKRKVFAEKIIGDVKKDLVEYKIYCLNGKAKFFAACVNRNTGNYHSNYYDESNNFLNISLKQDTIRPDLIDKMPNNIETIKKYAEKLAAPFIFVRVDLYNANGTIYLGEITVASHCGNLYFKNSTHDLIYGDLLDLTKWPKNNPEYDDKNMILLKETELKVPIGNFKKMQ